MLFVDIEKKLNNYTLQVKFEMGTETISLLGESGCGKSMTLRCIAGLEKPDRGHIELDGVVLFDSDSKINLPPGKRNVGYLFQDYALFPNMSVRQNVECGLREAKHRDSKNCDPELSDSKSPSDAVLSMLRKLHIEELKDRNVKKLSGGERQRVALARMLINEPRLLLFDEPFSALDSQMRFFLESEIRGLLTELKKPAILVSHNRDEAYRMSGKMAIMHRGRLETYGDIKEVFKYPGTSYGAAMTGCKNIAAAYPEEDDSVYIPDYALRLKVPSGALKDKQIKYVGLRMHDLHFIEESMGRENTFLAEVAEVIENPFSFTIMIRKKDAPDAKAIGVELPKEEWAAYRNREEFLLIIAGDRILLFEE